MKRATLAVIDEARCIGCTLCIAACPVDAISGAQGLMHTVIERYCIGCDLCIPPCPVDCIDMTPSTVEWTETDKAAAKQRARRRKARLAAPGTIPPALHGERRATVTEAIERAKAKRASHAKPT